MALNEITKGMSNAAEMIDQNFNKIDPMIGDTGNIDMIYVNGYKGNIQPVGQYRKVGKMVEVIFNITALQKTATNTNGPETFAILPIGYRPKKGFSFLARTNGTSETNPAKMTVEESGEIKFVGNNTNNQKSEDWVSGQIMFFIE